MDAASLFRWIAVGVVAANLVVSGAFRRRAARAVARPGRGDESSGLKALRAALALPALVGFLAYAVNPAWMSWAEIPLPIAIRWAGAALAVSTVPLVWWVLGHLGTNVTETVLTREGHALVATGPYRWVRHPLYSAGIAMWLGISLLSASAFFGVLTLLLLVTWIGIVIPREEAALIDAFGDRYVAYRERAGALLPRIGAS